MLKRYIFFCLTLILIHSLAGCGQNGPLYLPKTAPPPQQPPVAPKPEEILRPKTSQPETLELPYDDPDQQKADYHEI